MMRSVMHPLTVVGWLPQEYADVFYIVKGIVALVSTLVLVAHMNRSWYRFTTLGQRLRYLVLFGFTAVGAGGSFEQISEGAAVSYRNVGALLVFVFLAVTSVVSIRENQDESPLKRHDV
jgi:hypothetical protein